MTDSIKLKLPYLATLFTVVALSFLIIPFNVSGQQLTVKLSVQGPAMEMVANTLIIDKLQDLKTANLLIDSTAVQWESNSIVASASIRYKKDTGLFGLVVTVSGLVTSRWQPVWNEDGFLLRREDLSFRNTDPAMKAFDGIISVLADQQIPKSFHIPVQRLEDDLIRLVSKAKILDLKLAVSQASVSKITTDSTGIHAAIDIIGTLYSPDITEPDPTGGVHVSAAWMENQLTQVLRDSKAVKLDSASVRMVPAGWTLNTRLRIPFKWFWIFPDEIPRTVLADVQPEIKNNDLLLSFRTVDVYDRKPGEFSLINWYLKGRVEKELNRYQLPARLIPEETTITYKNAIGRILITSPVFKSINWTESDVRLGFSMIAILQF